MKKQVLLSVFAAALFAAPTASAFQGELPADTSKEANLFEDGNPSDVAHAGAKNLYIPSSKAKTAAANGVKVEDYANRVEEGKLVGKGKAAANKMAPKAGAKAPAGKVLPKTSAAK